MSDVNQDNYHFKMFLCSLDGIWCELLIIHLGYVFSLVFQD